MSASIVAKLSGLNLRTRYRSICAVCIGFIQRRSTCSRPVEQLRYSRYSFTLVPCSCMAAQPLLLSQMKLGLCPRCSWYSVETTDQFVPMQRRNEPAWGRNQNLTVNPSPSFSSVHTPLTCLFPTRQLSTPTIYMFYARDVPLTCMSHLPVFGVTAKRPWQTRALRVHTMLTYGRLLRTPR